MEILSKERTARPTMRFQNQVLSIPCDFQFIECDFDDLNDMENFTTTTTTTTTTTAAPVPHESFDCEQTDDFFVETTT
jgi:hypothetical protein